MDLCERIKGYTKVEETTTTLRGPATTQKEATAEKESGGGGGCLPALPAVLALALSVMLGIPYVLSKK